MIHKLSKGFQVVFILFLCSFLIYPLIFILIFQIKYKNKIYPNIKILDLNIGAKTYEEALLLLSHKLQQDPLNSLVLEYQNQQWLLNLDEINFRYLPQQTIFRAWQRGREKNLKTRILSLWELNQNPYNLTLDYNLDTNLLSEKIASIAAAINVPAIPPSLKIQTFPSKHIEIIPEQEGKELNQQLLIKLIFQNISYFEHQKIVLPVEIKKFEISPEKLEETKKRAEKLLNKSLILNAEQNQWQLNDEELISFLDFNNSYNKQKIDSYISQLAFLLEQPPQNALFNFKDGKVLEFKPAAEGKKLDQQKANNLFIQSLAELESLAEKKTTFLTLPLIILKPEITTEDANNFGIKELIGRGESWFKGSISSRIHNIQLASQKFNGLLIKPGEIFSFNQAIGEVSAKTGYKPAYIIKDGRTILGDGGGVCQVSTTLFRAALSAGLPIIERHPHAYRVSYYEQNSQPGLDATVFSPSVDLKILNDTPAYILIQTSVDLHNFMLTFDLYGASDGRQAFITNHRVWDQVPPPPPLYQDDPTLPPGTIKQIDWPAWGAKAAFDWKVVKDGKNIYQQTFFSQYRPWQAVYLKGPGG